MHPLAILEQSVVQAVHAEGLSHTAANSPALSGIFRFIRQGSSQTTFPNSEPTSDIPALSVMSYATATNFFTLIRVPQNAVLGHTSLSGRVIFHFFLKFLQETSTCFPVDLNLRKNQCGKSDIGLVAQQFFERNAVC